MPYSVWQAFITDGGEQVVPAATIDVYLESSGAPAAIYDGPAGAALGSSTVSGADGLAKFFAPAGVYKIVATKGAFSKEFRYVQLGNASSHDTGTGEDDVLTKADADTQYIRQDELAVAEGVATTDADNRLVQDINAGNIVGVIDASNLPSYVDDVIERANYAAMIAIAGETGKIYITLDDDHQFRWTGSAYVDITGGLSAIPTMTMLGNNTGGSAVPTALTKTDVQTLLDIGWVLQSRSVAAPNATVPAHRIIPVGAEANIDVVLQPKGTGAVLLTLPDNVLVGGTKRGARAIDLQVSRSVATIVASGDDAIALGNGNTASNTSSCAVGSQNTVSGSNSGTLGLGNTLSGTWSYAIGRSNTVTGGQSIAVGESNSVANGNSGAFGRSNTVAAGAGSNTYVFGYSNNPTVGVASYFFGAGNTGGGFLFGSSNSGASGYCYALGSSNTTKHGMLLGFSNTQAGNNGMCYALGGSNSITDGNAASMVLGSNNTMSSPVGSVVVGNLANVGWQEDYAIIRSLRRVAASKTSHVREVHPGGITTDATVTPLTIGTSGIYSADKVLMVEGTVNLITATFVAISSTDRKTWKVEASVYQQTGYSAPTIDVQTITEVYESAGATAWDLTMTAATGYTLDFNATGVAATTIKWLGKVEITQLQL